LNIFSLDTDFLKVAQMAQLRCYTILLFCQCVTPITYEGIGTVTPGVISRTRSHIPHLKFRISVPIRGGFKVIARQGKTAQEIFILTSLDQDALQGLLQNL
jgi:hypothetical protein